jgi:copper chaperone CopZ
MEKKLSIEGMTCMHCSGRVQKYLESNNAISDVTIDLEGKEAAFSCDDTVDVDAVAKGITELGYPAKEK